MRSPAHVLVVDDAQANIEIPCTWLRANGFTAEGITDGETALGIIRSHAPDLVLLDIMMPGLDGIEVTRRIKADRNLPFIPIILLTAKSDPNDVVQGLDAGADEYLVKPYDPSSLMARVRAMLRVKSLHDEVATLNRELSDRVAAQVAELQRLSALRRFLPPQLADMIVTRGEDHILEHHRRDIAVLFCDLRDFTAFAESAEPEDVMALLAEYHGTLGPLIHAYEGTLDGFAGDGIMVFFNDPVPVPDAALRAVKLAQEMREAVK